jgi:hypothetical protein
MAGAVVADELAVTFRYAASSQKLGSTIAAKEPQNINKK